MATFLTLTARQYQRLLCLLGYCSLLVLLAGCGTALTPFDNKNSHLGATPAAAETTPGTIPGIVNPVSMVPPPSAAQEQELYTAVAQDVPIRDFLFSMARDAAINVDVDPNVTGIITLNAIDQSLPQILERISHQANIRWNFDDAGNLIVKPDDPFWKTYTIDYVNVDRSSSTTTQVSTSIASNVGGGGGGGARGGGNNSSSSMTQTSRNNFWRSLNNNLATLLGAGGDGGGNGDTFTASPNIAMNAESGVVSIRGNSRQQAEIAEFITRVTQRSLYQVLIEATVVEVTLGDKYQAGVDWATLGRNHGELNLQQQVLGANLKEAPTTILTLDKSLGADAITLTMALLSQFGETSVLSSPQTMSLNNQTAILRVVENKVYFTIEVQPGTRGTAVTPGTDPVYTSTIQTLPVGFVMPVTAQIAADDQVTLYVRPTISRITGYVNDPNPELAKNNVKNAIPETSTREMESVLKVYSGQVAILGGLMQDSLDKGVDGFPGLSRMPFIRNLFSHRTESANKTELIIFIRPVVIKDASIDGDLKNYQQYLPSKSLEEESSAINTKVIPSYLKGKSD